MTKQIINIGTSANKGNGDPLRTAFAKVNENFDELYTALGLNADGTLSLGAFEFTGSVMTTTDSTAITIDQATTVTSNLTVGGDVLPSLANGGNLGSLAAPWNSVYVSNSTIYFGGIPLSVDVNGNLLVNNQLVTGGGGSSVTTGATAPIDPSIGDLWYDTASGRTYVYYDSSWIDASPVDGAGINSTNELVNGAHTVSLSSGGLTAFPAISNESLFIQASELGSANASIGISAKNNVIVTANILDTAKQWTFGTEGKLTLPAGTTYEYLSVPLTGHGDGLAVLDFALVTDGVDAQWIASSPNPEGVGYSVGDTFTFDEDFLGIPGASTTIEVLTIGLGGSIVEIGFSPAPLYPADIYRDSPINLQVGTESNRWTFDANGKLTTPGDIQLGTDSYLRFSDSSFQGTAFVGDATRLYGNVDEDVEVTVRHRPAVSAECAARGGGDNFVADTSDNDDITVVQEGWTVDIGGTVYTVTAIIDGIDEFDIYATGATFVVGTTYTFTNPTATLQTWTFNQQTGTLIAPGGAILSSESITEAELTSRDFSIELPTEDGTNEHRWTFDNGIGSLTVPGPIRQGDAKLAFNENGGVNVYLTAVDTDETAVFINTTSVQAYARESVSLQVGARLNELSVAHSLLEADWVNAREADAFIAAPTIREWQGLESWLAYPILVNSSPDLDPPMAPNLPTVANSAKQAYDLWQNTKSDTTVSMAVGDNVWVFDADGKITLPNNGVIRVDDSNIEVGTVNNFNVEAGGVVNVYTNTNGVSTYQWQFGDDGGLIFPNTTVQTTAYIPPTTGNSIISSQDPITISRNGMTIKITAAGVVQMSFDSVIDIRGRSSINNAGSTTIATPNGDTVIGDWYDISTALALGDQLVATIVDSSFHNVYRITVIAREQDTTPGVEFTTAYAIIEQIQ